MGVVKSTSGNLEKSRRFWQRPRKCNSEMCPSCMKCMKLQVTEDNRTLSTLFLHASREMHGGKLSCQVENPMVPNSRIEDSRTLQIHCKNTKFSTNSTLTNCFGHCHRPWVCFLSLCSHYQRASERASSANVSMQSCNPFITSIFQEKSTLFILQPLKMIFQSMHTILHKLLHLKGPLARKFKNWI